MKQYVIYSAWVHVGLIAVLFFILRPSLNNLSKNTVYTIDFIGNNNSNIIETTKAKNEPPQTKQPEPQRNIQNNTADTTKKAIQRPDFSDQLPTQNKKKIVLSQPSILKNEASKSAQSPAETSTISESGGISADFPDFPYPWYITRVRAMLWDEWSARMPGKSNRSCVVTFKIQRNGKIKSAYTQTSSGNKLFDYSALSSAENASPFPPLPDDYKEPELIVHVEFKAVNKWV